MVSTASYLPGNAQHIGSRDDQQDSFGFSPLEEDSSDAGRGFVATLADGMGGLRNGRQSSQTAIQAFLASYATKPAEESAANALQRALTDANSAVIAAAQASGDSGETGTTLVAAVLHEQSLYWLSVGDSALYLVRRGRLTLLNAVHTYAADLDRQVRDRQLAHDEAIAHPDRGALTSYLGQSSPALVDLSWKPFQLEADDQILLASDGVFKTLTERQMEAAIDTDPQRTCEQLVERALAVGKAGQDNLTVLAIGLAGIPAEMEESRPELPVGQPAVLHRRRRGYTAFVFCLLLVGALLAVGIWRHTRQKKAPPTPVVTPVDAPISNTQSSAPPALDESSAETRGDSSDNSRGKR